jgi:phage-related protein
VYNVVFENDNGSKYYFGANGSTVFDMDFGNGVSVDVGTSQGFSQVGETIQNMAVSGRPINVKGVVYGNVQERKNSMRKVISPFSCGSLVFENKYYIRVCVKSAPTFSPVKNDGRFTLQFFAPYPFFKSVKELTWEIGSIKALFSFPVNYAVPHKFGEKGTERYKKIYNDSDVKVPFSLHISSSGTSTNLVVANLNTFKKLKLNGTINAGDFVEIYRNNDNVLRAELNSNGEKTDVISWIDESSDLFELEVGDNLISALDDEGGASLSIRISYNPVVVAVYES